MNRLRVFVFAILVAAAGRLPAAAPPARAEPLKGVVASGVALAFLWTTDCSEVAGTPHPCYTAQPFTRMRNLKED